MNVTDLSKACATKTQAEVTKEFVSAASFILSAAVGGDKGGKKSVGKKVKRTTKPLWDPKKFETKQYFSQTAYLNVTDIAGNKVTVKNSWGNTLYVSKDILENMVSGNHYDKEVPMNMTGLAELLQSVQDYVLTVSFRKQATEENAYALLRDATKASFSDKSKLA